MRVDISEKAFWWDMPYSWNNNKARRKRRDRLQKAKRATRRVCRQTLKNSFQCDKI
jgi:hypothetical protein